MAKPAQHKNLNPILKVNLLHPQGQQLKLPGRLLSWLLDYGRFIIIAVEIVVIVCFLVRFKLDADLEKLNQQIRAEAASIESHSSDELLVKQTQQKLQLIKQTYDTTPDWRNLFTKLLASVPTTVSFNNLALLHEQNTKSVQFKIVASAKTSGDLAAFLNALKEPSVGESEKTFTDINLTNVGLDKGQINFTVNGSTR